MYRLRDYQLKASNAAVDFFNSNKKNNAIMVLPTGCHAKGTKILMFDGSLKNVEDIIVGDKLVGSDGKERRVLELHHGIDDMYEIEPIKGDKFVVNGGHILSLHKTNEGKDYPSCKQRVDEISVKDYIHTSHNYKHLHKLYKPSFVGFADLDNELPINPYFLGVYLGDGSSANGSISVATQRKEVADFIIKYTNELGLRNRIAEKSNGGKAPSYFINGDGRKNQNILILKLKEIGLFKHVADEKFIPKQYLTSTKANRLSLLAGLLDTDACYINGGFEYSTKSKKLADDIVFLCRSLGFSANIGKVKIVKGISYYRMQINGDLELIPTKVGIRQAEPRKQKKNVRVTGFFVKYVGNGEYYGFTIDKDHLYCDGQFFVHHNSGKSLIIADIANRLDGHTLVFQPSKEIKKKQT